MQEPYYTNLHTFEDWEAHRSVVLSLIKENNELIEQAIKIVELYHNTPRTLYVGTYNRHPLRVARILLEEFGVKNTRTILIALCHDLGEWSDYDVKNLENKFGADVRIGVEKLTRNEDDAWEEFFQKIIDTDNMDLLKIKMVDKLDNNRGAAFSSDKRQKSKAREKTELIMRPFILQHFPEYWGKFEESLLLLST